jgi:glycerate dehydrogenase
LGQVRVDQRPDVHVTAADLLAKADVLSLHCPLTPATRHLIGEPKLTWCGSIR